MSEEEKAEFIAQVKYFWNEKGDIERYVGFTMDKLREADPVLADAVERFRSAEQTLNRLLEY